MRDKMRFAGKLVGAGALTALLATAAVAAPAPRNGGQRDSGHVSEQRAAGGEQQWRPARQQGILRGVIERINPRYATMTIRDEATGRFVNVDMQQMGGRGVRGLRRGEFVTVSGQWERGNAFAAYRID